MGGAVMPHAQIRNQTDVRAEADSRLPTCPLLRCPHPDPGVNSEKDRTWRHHGAIPGYPKEFPNSLSASLAYD